MLIKKLQEAIQCDGDCYDLFLCYENNTYTNQLLKSDFQIQETSKHLNLEKKTLILKI